MENLLKLEKPHIDLGSNHFLTHLTHEVKIGQRVIGHAMITLYNFKEASMQNTAWKWLSHEGSYLHNYKDYLFDNNVTKPCLPESLQAEVIDSDTLVIIDEITMEPFFQGKKIESYVLTEIIEMYEKKSDIIMLSGHQQFGEKMGLDKELMAVMYCQLGFVWADNFMGVKFKSIPMDDIEEISELTVNLNSYG